MKWQLLLLQIVPEEAMIDVAGGPDAVAILHCHRMSQSVNQSIQCSSED